MPDLHDDLILAAVLAGARMAKDQAQTPERAAELLREALRDVERSKPGNAEIIEAEVDPTRLAAR